MDERLGALEPGLVAALLLALTCLALLAALAVLGRTRGQPHTSKQQQIVESIIQVTSRSVSISSVIISVISQSGDNIRVKREIEQSLEEHHSMEKQLDQQEQEQEQVSPVSLPSKILLCPLESGVR